MTTITPVVYCPNCDTPMWWNRRKHRYDCLLPTCLVIYVAFDTLTTEDEAATMMRKVRT